MSRTFRYRFAPGVDLVEAEATLQVAVLAAEGLYGAAQLRTEFSYLADDDERSITLEACSAPGEAVMWMFTALLIREFGERAFAVGRVVRSKGVVA